MNIKEFRENAIKRYKNGESPKESYQSLGYGKPGYLYSPGLGKNQPDLFLSGILWGKADIL